MAEDGINNPSSNEEEIDLNGPTRPMAQPPVEGSQESETAVEDSPMDDPNVDLSSEFKDTDNATDLLNRIVGMEEDKFIPWEEVTLPSQGAFYNGGIPNGIVRVRAMGIHAEKILATQRLAQTGQSIDYLFEHCVQVPDGFDVRDLLSGDRVFLLYVIRGITHGNTYEFTMKCPNCGTISTHMYDLNNLAYTMRGPDQMLGEEPFRVDLPYFSKTVGKKCYVLVRFLRGRDVSDVANRARFNRKVHGKPPRLVGAKTESRSTNVVIDETLTENLNLVIKGFGFDGDAKGAVGDPVQIKHLVDRLHARDTATIREFLKEKSPGIDTEIEIDCPECDHTFRTNLPITEGFFRPASEG